MNVTIQVTDEADDRTRAAILEPLLEYNRMQTKTDDYRPLVARLTDHSGKIIGGLWGRTAYGWLFIELLFVPEELRAMGTGRTLVQHAETEAVERGCTYAWLDTFEFQSRGFYEKLGYKCFAELAEYPSGYSRFFMKKRLSK